MFKQYVLGLLFTTKKDVVWLIRKNRPAWQRGLLNGIGGQVETAKGERPDAAMVREFEEEAGLHIDTWKFFCSLGDDRSYQIHCYYAFSDEIPTSMTDEVVISYCYDGTQHWLTPTVVQIQWLIPMALSFSDGERADWFVVTERCKSPI